MLMEKFISGGKIEFHPNPNCVTFHMRHEFLVHGRWYTSDIINEWEDGDPYLTKVLTADLLKIHGVKDVSVGRHEISITKATAFTFPELMPAIKLSMAKYLPSRYS